MFGFSTEFSLNVSNTFTVNVLRKEMTVVIPVKVTLRNGFRTKVEYGEYRCERGNSITTDFKEEKL